MIVLLLTGLLTLLLIFLLGRSIQSNRFWPSMGVPQLPTWPIFGHSLDALLRRCAVAELQAKACRAFPNSQFVGFVDTMKPQLMIKDPRLIEHILVKDFNCFEDRGFVINEKTQPLDQNLFFMRGNQWRAIRNKFSPLFTTGKLRGMTFQMSDISVKMIEFVTTTGESGIELGKVLSRFAMNVIGSCTFGIDTGTLTEDTNKFKEMAEKHFKLTFPRLLTQIFLYNFPALGRKLGITFNLPDVMMYFSSVVQDTMSARRMSKETRNDFLQLLLTLKDKGSVDVTSKDPADDYLNLGDFDEDQNKEKYEITDDLLIGQSFIFLSAGFETTALALTFTCYELAMNPLIQEKARRDVIDALGSTDSNEITYDQLKKMNYMENCIKEALRKFPPVDKLYRVCTKDYQIPNSSLFIKKGTSVIVPIYAVHHDPEIHSNPDEYRPERFDDGVPKYGYLPFGEGPRICIAMRFAQTEMRCCLARLLRSYKISINSKTKLPITIFKGLTVFLTPSSPIYFDLTPIQGK